MNWLPNLASPSPWNLPAKQRIQRPLDRLSIGKTHSQDPLTTGFERASKCSFNAVGRFPTQESASRGLLRLYAPIVTISTGKTGNTESTGRVKRSGDDRIFTVPNVFSLFRLLLVPVFVWLLFGRDNRLQAALLLAGIGGTDWVDGWYARKYNQVSTLGKILDPAADRILLGVGAISIIVDGSIPRWLGIVIVIREIVVSVAVLALAASGARRIDVQWSGKAATMGLMIAFPLFLVSKSTVAAADVLRIAAWIVVIPSVLMSFVATAGYVPLAKTALAEGRAKRSS